MGVSSCYPIIISGCVRRAEFKKDRWESCCHRLVRSIKNSEGGHMSTKATNLFM